MKAILRTNNYDKNFDIVEVIQNPISKTNNLALVRLSNGKEVITGGILIDYNPLTEKILNSMNYKGQWIWLLTIKRPKCSYVNLEN
jgi:hypothetical protein